MLYQNNYFFKDTVVHKIHPTIKFFIFLLIIFLLFLKVSVVVHLSIFVLTVFIACTSQCFKYIYKKIIFFYILLFFILSLINWFFNKNPGVWYKTNLENNYHDILAMTKTATKTASSSNGGENVMHGWFYGGQFIKNSSNTSTIELAASKDSLETTASSSSLGGKRLQIIQIIADNNATKYVGFSSVWYTVTAKQFLLAWNLTNKLVTVIMLSSVLIMSTKMSNLAYALEDIFKPLKLLKLPAKEMALIVAIAFRFTPSLLQESLRIIKAQASRGIDFKNGKAKDKVVAVISLFVPLFVVAFMKSDELASAMIARGYKPKTCRSSHRINNLSHLHLFTFSTICTFLSFLYFFHFNNFFCSFFGQVEYLMMIAK